MATTSDDHLLAAELATGAGALLMDLRRELSRAGASASEIKDEGDRRSHEWLMDRLSLDRPADGVLSEEATEVETRNSSRLEHERVWVIDPLDGTREYGEGRSDWAVHVALAIKGAPAHGAVALPAQGVTFDTADPPPIPPCPEVPRVVLSRSRPPVAALRIAAAMGAQVIEMGSAGAKAMSIIQGLSDIYPHAGGQYEWDSCAPVAVAMAAGLHCSRLDGNPLRYNREDPWLPDLLICREEHAAAAIAAADDRPVG